MMAYSLNKVILIGNLGFDPEIRQTSEGKKIASLRLATSERWKDKGTGDLKEKTEWHRVVVFNEGLVNVVENYAKKGTKMYIEGSLQTRKWQDSSGQDKYTTEIALQGFSAQLILLDGKANSDSSGGDMQNNSKSFDHSELDDEIPF